MPNQRLELKQRLLAECVRMQNTVVDNARKAMNEYQESAMEYDESAEDNMVDSYREEMQNKRDMFARQLEHALEDLAMLHKVAADREQDSALFGSVIITESQKLFISISLGQIKLDNEQFFAISPAAPLFKAMNGVKSGQSFNFRDKQTMILEVY
ncbi:MAG: hypothetical protein V4543_04665 [Bacteroidota bacterium]